jgi:hypothetical protein
VYAADLDGDGDPDVLSASYDDDKIAWYANDGTGQFGSQQVITTAAEGANCVYAADLDGDSDLDVLSASSGYDFNNGVYIDMVAWYMNGGSGQFNSRQVITTEAVGADSVYAADLDADGDLDVLSASYDDGEIAWYANDGTGQFGSQQVITTEAVGAQSVYATDLDGDGDPDVLSASSGYDWDNDVQVDWIAWYANDGTGQFGSQQVITTEAVGAQSVCAADLDGDGDPDVLSASSNYDYDFYVWIANEIAWYANDGTGQFGSRQVITAAAEGADYVYAADVDGDGDVDVLSASSGDNKIAWYENE